MIQFDYIVVGGGLAGLYTSYKLSHLGRVALVARASLEDSNSFYAQGGVAAVTEEQDTPTDHLKDTLVAGRGLCIENSVKILTEEAPRRIEELISLGMNFDTQDGHLALGLEGGHHHKRILHAGGDATGRMLSSFMISKVKQNPSISILDHHQAIKLSVSNTSCRGLWVYNEFFHRIEYLGAKAIILATGGAAALYHPTTNPPTALGDGLAMALLIGAELRDMEFIQFHPTALYAPQHGSFLISEAVRGEGAYLLNARKERFMLDRHPLAELAPRDTVAYEIFHEMQQGGEKHVTLSLKHLDAAYIRNRFPTISRRCAEIGFDFTQEIPVAPAAHYTVGGIITDLYGKTNIQNLFAVGEIASTGVMGANRLASNSLIECLVFGKRIADYIAQGTLSLPPSLEDPPMLDVTLYSKDEEHDWERVEGVRIMDMLGEVLMQEVGIIRSQTSLQRALDKIDLLFTQIDASERRDSLQAYIHRSRLFLARRIVMSAQVREESRGGHFRSDYPDTLPPEEAYHTIMSKDLIKKIYISR